MSKHIAEDEIANLESELRDSMAESAKLRTQNAEMRSRIELLDQIIDSCIEVLAEFAYAAPESKMAHRVVKLREVVGTSRADFQSKLAELEK